MLVTPSTGSTARVGKGRAGRHAGGMTLEQEVATGQWGIVSRAQLSAAGMSPEAIRWRAARQWRSLLPGVYAIEPGRLGLHQAAMAAQLYVGPSGLLGGPSAARLHGVESVRLTGLIDVVVPMNGRTRTIGHVRITRTRISEPVPHHHGSLSLMSPARAVAEALRRMPTDEVAAEVAIEAVQRRIAALDDLRHWTSLLGRAGSARAERALSVVASGAWSVPEHRLAHAVTGVKGLPGLWLNPTLRDEHGAPLISPDLWFDEVALAVMVHSRRYHSTGDQWDATVTSDAELSAAGVVVVGVTPHQISRAMPEVLARIARAYAAASRRPRPGVKAVPHGRDGVRLVG